MGSYFLYNHFKEKAYVFDTSCINELGKKKNQNTEPMLIDEVKAISEDEKSNIVKGRNENIKSILASREVKEKGNSLLIFSDGREVEGKELNLDENFRQDKDSKMLYFKLDGKLYELGEYMVEKAKDPNSEDTYFFACVDKKVWDDNALFNMNFGYTNDEISKIYKGDSWRTLLFVGYIYEA